MKKIGNDFLNFVKTKFSSKKNSSERELKSTRQQMKLFMIPAPSFKYPENQFFDSHLSHQSTNNHTKEDFENFKEKSPIFILQKTKSNQFNSLFFENYIPTYDDKEFINSSKTNFHDSVESYLHYLDSIDHAEAFKRIRHRNFNRYFEKLLEPNNYFDGYFNDYESEEGIFPFEM
ncbi:13504_t:CDS:1 [Ambispora gerdemannii]|uniref:13504_t:CDS:1 n=1 Tax=Ambispora gerdemannii TaxID=144530 RepID=A0A9N8ZKX0_9GLOM|nr:13504_t:CDS:1 [Ambispora gerdemannii]